MKKDIFIHIIAKISKTPKKKIKMSLRLELLNYWDSLIAIQILSEFEKKSKKKISITKFAKAKIINDLYKTIK
jgi:acyl carrier protein